MHAAVIHEAGGPEALLVQAWPTPESKEGEVRIRNELPRSKLTGYPSEFSRSKLRGIRPYGQIKPRLWFLLSVTIGNNR